MYSNSFPTGLLLMLVFRSILSIKQNQCPANSNPNNNPINLQPNSIDSNYLGQNLTDRVKTDFATAQNDKAIYKQIDESNFINSKKDFNSNKYSPKYCSTPDFKNQHNLHYNKLQNNFNFDQIKGKLDLLVLAVDLTQAAFNVHNLAKNLNNVEPKRPFLVGQIKEINTNGLNSKDVDSNQNSKSTDDFNLKALQSSKNNDQHQYVLKNRFNSIKEHMFRTSNKFSILFGDILFAQGSSMLSRIGLPKLVFLISEAIKETSALKALIKSSQTHQNAKISEITPFMFYNNENFKVLNSAPVSDENLDLLYSPLNFTNKKLNHSNLHPTEATCNAGTKHDKYSRTNDNLTENTTNYKNGHQCFYTLEQWKCLVNASYGSLFCYGLLALVELVNSTSKANYNLNFNGNNINQFKSSNFDSLDTAKSHSDCLFLDRFNSDIFKLGRNISYLISLKYLINMIKNNYSNLPVFDINNPNDLAYQSRKQYSSDYFKYNCSSKIYPAILDLDPTRIKEFLYNFVSVEETVDDLYLKWFNDYLVIYKETLVLFESVLDYNTTQPLFSKSIINELISL